ncbi:hypothetical protein C8039_19885 [Halogeometricum sp. wsp3]|nr:hypothetical protein C8039_19885 [Halogeometricum sp. wsp3]
MTTHSGACSEDRCDRGSQALREYLDLLDTTDWLRAASRGTSTSRPVSPRTSRTRARTIDVSAGASIQIKQVPDPYRGPQTRPWDHFAQALGFPSGLSGCTYYDRVIARLNRTKAPRTVASHRAPCKETVRTGTEVDLLSFPWPYIHEGDGGRYSNHHTIVAPDPDTEWGTWSSHRMMIHDSSQAGLL